MAGVNDLTNEQAVGALRLVAQAWLANDGLNAFGVMADARDYVETRSLSLPGWASGMPLDLASLSDDEAKEIGNHCRAALQTLTESPEPSARKWTADAIGKVTQPHGQVVELVLAIKGVILIGMILAARVKKIDSEGIEFYQGLPKGLSTLLTASRSFFNI
jgi:hypothetical protein